MARNKRMFSNDIVGSDAFMDLPPKSQLLYFHIVMNADDDGFNGSVKRLCVAIGCNEKDLDELLKERFLLKINNVIVVKHWKINNTIQKDRYVPTKYQDEFKMLSIKDNGSYTDKNISGDKVETKCIHNKSEAVNKDNPKLDSDCTPNMYKGNKREKEKDINTLDDSVEPSIAKSTQLDAFYDSIWKMYPRKEGKGAVSKTQKQKLQKIGYEQLKRCVDRYMAKLEKDGTDKKFIMHGSTFFNSGYVDYLDENYDQVDIDADRDSKSDETDRFAGLDPDKRAELEFLGIIEGQSLALGDATEGQIKYLQEAGVL